MSDRELKINELKRKISEIDIRPFGKSTLIKKGPYNPPALSMKRGVHPRLIVNAEMLSDVRAVLEAEGYCDTLSANFRELADTHYEGLLPPTDEKKPYNYDGIGLAVIEAKALTYLLTGDELYGLEAIYAILNYLPRLVITKDMAGDIFRGYGWAMLTAGEVYDWCFDLMTDRERELIVAGVEHYCCDGGKMTMGFPPEAMNAVQGHGTNVQLLRDYLGFAVAVADERPDWWNFIGGRFFDEFIPANNVMYPAGTVSQGTNNYGWSKYYSQMFSAWIVKTYSGINPYHKGMEDVMYSFLSTKLPNGRYFESGDGACTGDGSVCTYPISIAYLSAALYPSMALQAHLKELSESYTKYVYGGIKGNFVSPSWALIWRAASYPKEELGRAEDLLPHICYNPSPVGQLIARNSFEKDAAISFMRVGELNTCNHDHRDSGTFQLYYKGMQACESGNYGTGSGYGSDHHKCYAQGTVAHNGILVYNPALKDEERGWYSGGQKVFPAPATIDVWLSGNYNMGKITGAQNSTRGGTCEYAYLAGDLSCGYDERTVSELERRMLTVFSSSKDFPMFFFVSDRISAKDASFKKTFLLHTPKEPTVLGNKVTGVHKGGKLVLYALSDFDKIEKLGGEGKTFLINGRQCNGEGAPDGEVWGRVEISMSGSVTNDSLYAMYVTDAENEKDLIPTLIENEKIHAALLGDCAAVFVKSLKKETGEVSLTLPAAKRRRFFVSGLAAGTWQITEDSRPTLKVGVTEEGGLARFDSSAENLTLKRLC